MSDEARIKKSPDSNIQTVVGSLFFNVDKVRLNASNSAFDLNGFEDILIFLKLNLTFFNFQSDFSFHEMTCFDFRSRYFDVVKG